MRVGPRPQSQYSSKATRAGSFRTRLSVVTTWPRRYSSALQPIQWSTGSLSLTNRPSEPPGVRPSCVDRQAWCLTAPTREHGIRCVGCARGTPAMLLLGVVGSRASSCRPMCALKRANATRTQLCHRAGRGRRKTARPCDDGLEGSCTRRSAAMCVPGYRRLLSSASTASVSQPCTGCWLRRGRSRERNCRAKETARSVPRGSRKSTGSVWLHSSGRGVFDCTIVLPSCQAGSCQGSSRCRVPPASPATLGMDEG